MLQPLIRVVTIDKRLYFHRLTECYVTSHPKCGRTWLKVMLAKALALHFGMTQALVYDPVKVIRENRLEGPLVRFTHDRDVLVSYY